MSCWLATASAAHHGFRLRSAEGYDVLPANQGGLGGAEIALVDLAQREPAQDALDRCAAIYTSSSLVPSALNLLTLNGW